MEQLPDTRANRAPSEKDRKAEQARGEREGGKVPLVWSSVTHLFVSWISELPISFVRAQLPSLSSATSAAAASTRPRVMSSIGGSSTALPSGTTARVFCTTTARVFGGPFFHSLTISPVSFIV